MEMLKSFLILILLVQKFIYLHSAKVNFNIYLGESRIEIECNYTLKMNEKLNMVQLSKDGQMFYEIFAGEETCKSLIWIISYQWSIN